MKPIYLILALCLVSCRPFETPTHLADTSSPLASLGADLGIQIKKDLQDLLDMIDKYFAGSQIDPSLKDAIDQIVNRLLPGSKPVTAHTQTSSASVVLDLMNKDIMTLASQSGKHQSLQLPDQNRTLSMATRFAKILAADAQLKSEINSLIQDVQTSEPFSSLGISAFQICASSPLAYAQYKSSHQIAGPADSIVTQFYADLCL